jgi:hypothetical protein
MNPLPATSGPLVPRERQPRPPDASRRRTAYHPAQPFITCTAGHRRSVRGRPAYNQPHVVIATEPNGAPRELGQPVSVQMYQFHRAGLFSLT